jgi:hypothetical protein
VPQDVGGKGEGARVVEDVGVGGEFVHELVDRPGRQTPAAAIENSAGVSAPGQEARSVRHSVMEVRAVPSRSGISREVSPLPERR